MTRDLVDQMGGGRGREPERVSDDQASLKAKLHDLTMMLHYDTGKAVLVSDTGEESKAVWLPHTQIEILNEGKIGKGVNKRGAIVSLPVITVTIPEWLAKNKGLI